jgi:2,3,4,5-tetrahydropyridine-2,6-dicarboxylate N-succinyltransferase
MQVVDLAAFKQTVENIESKAGYTRPQAFGIGIATVDATGRILSTHFPAPNFQSNFGSAAVMAEVLGYTNGTQSFRVSVEQLDEMLSYFTPFENDGKQHPNIEVMKRMKNLVSEINKKVAIATFIAAESHPQEIPDAYLRLHLLSHGLAKPEQINLNGIIEVLAKQ